MHLRSCYVCRSFRVAITGAFATVAVMGAATAVHAQTYNWTFGTTGSGTSTAPANASALPTNTIGNLTISEGITQGNNNGTTTLLTSTSASSGYTGASGDVNAGLAARTGVLATGTGGSAYFEFAITPASGYAVQVSSLSFGSRSTSTGPVSYSVVTSDLSTTLGTAALAGTNTATWALQPSAITTYTSATNTTLTLRIYGYGGTGSAAANTANWRIDDLNVSASAVQVSGNASAPEPGSIALLALSGLPALGTIAHRRRRKAA